MAFDPSDKDVMETLLWITRNGHKAAQARMADALRTALPLERLKITATLANAQTRTFLSAIADETVDMLVDQTSAPDVARMAGISVTMVHRRRHRAKQRREVRATRKSGEH